MTTTVVTEEEWAYWDAVADGRREPREDVPDGHKRCKKCKNVKRHDEFYRQQGNPDGRSRRCKPCSYKRRPEAPPCKGVTAKGRPCGNKGVFDGFCHSHSTRGDVPVYASDIERLRAAGLTFKEIGEKVGAGYLLVEMNCPREFKYLSKYDLRILRACRPPQDPDGALRLVVRERARRDERRRRRNEDKIQRRTRPISLDAPLPNVRPGSTLVGHDAQAATHPEPMEAVLGAELDRIVGDLTLAEIAQLGEYEAALLRERLTQAGIGRPSVQEAERTRLRDVTPHRGHSPTRTGRVGMAGTAKSRTRKQRSARHKAVDKRYKRREKRPDDGWGGVVVPDEAAA